MAQTPRYAKRSTEGESAPPFRWRCQRPWSTGIRIWKLLPSVLGGGILVRAQTVGLSARSLALPPQLIYPEWSQGALMVTAGSARGSFDRSVLVLISLANGAKHGYALITDVESFAGVRLGPGTLYGSLAKLESAGLIEALPAEERRHPYKITSRGLEVLRQELAESARIAAIGLGRVKEAGT